jgi:hypothetical protein
MAAELESLYGEYLVMETDEWYQDAEEILRALDGAR